MTRKADMDATSRDSGADTKVGLPTETGMSVAAANIASAETLNKSCPFLKLPTEIRDKIYGYVLPKATDLRPGSRTESRRGHSPLNILLANRRIHAEASSVLYSHSPVITTVYKPDVIRPRRFHPSVNAKGLDVDGAAAFRWGTFGSAIYPHVLARFRRITLHVALFYKEWGSEFGYACTIESLVLNPEFKVVPISAKKIAEKIRKNRILDEFARIISDLGHLVRLDIKISVNVHAVINDKIFFGSDRYNFRDAEETPRAKKEANRQAIRMFLESGQLDKLRKVSTIQSITLTFYSEDGPWLEDDMLPVSLEAVKDLQQAVERNWEERHQSMSKLSAAVENLKILPSD